jgi:hypothetical protein
MAIRGVKSKTLQKKCDKWKKVLRLGDWNITCRYANSSEMKDKETMNEDDIGVLEQCHIHEKIALILINKHYYNHNAFGLSWNLDTLILHELIHIIQSMAMQSLTKKMKESPKMDQVEEFNCDTFAAIIYFTYYNKI